ncbi:L-type lectin-domain containing receptor kinaseS.1 [Striga asiatica]|uniref:L-type lectin-domain containing receptor kinaseS.1 n=1 Tax=Striga asiatica TaxID=4170 RepID=A0A5A7QML3_STRAF|nr:L-type lectin-domain containing receptor kinaseS.1 [Striga asiatica]
MWHLLTFSKLPSHDTMDNIFPDWHIKNVTSQYHETFIFIVKICNRNHHVLIETYNIKSTVSQTAQYSTMTNGLLVTNLLNNICEQQWVSMNTIKGQIFSTVPISLSGASTCLDDNKLAEMCLHLNCGSIQKRNTFGKN